MGKSRAHRPALASARFNMKKHDNRVPAKRRSFSLLKLPRRSVSLAWALPNAISECWRAKSASRLGAESEDGDGK